MSQEFTVGWLSLDSTHMNLSQSDFPTNAEVTDDDSGSLYAEAQALTGFAPVGSGTTSAIKSLLSNIGVSGQCVQSGASIEVADIIQRALGNCDNPLSGTPHFRHRVTRGLILPDTLTMSRNQDAKLSFSLHTFTDNSGNAPVAETDGVAAVTPIVSERYRLAVSKIAGVQFPEIEEVNLTFNIEITPKEPKLATISPLTAGVLTVRPVYLLRGRDLTRVKAGLIELGANGATHANTIFQLARIESAASFYAPGTSNHITATSYGVAVPANLASGSARSRSTNEIRLEAGFDGTNAPIVFTYDTTYNTNP